MGIWFDDDAFTKTPNNQPADVAIAIAVGIAAAISFIVWFEPCNTDQICGSAFMPMAALEPRRLLRAWYLRWRIKCAEQDLEHMLEDYDYMPTQLAQHSIAIGRWRCQLIDCEAPARRD